jgi:hypothetical protein
MDKRKAISSKGCISTDKAISPHKSQQGGKEAFSGYSVPQAGIRVGQAVTGEGGLKKAMTPSGGRGCV